MIREQFIMSAGPVASEMPLLVPKNNTLLAEAVGSLRGPMNYFTGDNNPDLSSYSREVDQLYEGQNDTMLDTIAGHAADVLKDTMGLARSVVNPAIQDGAQKAQSLVNARSDEYAADDVVVNAVPKAQVWRSQTLYQTTEPYADAGAEDFNVEGLYDPREEIPVSLLIESIPSAGIAQEINEMLDSSDNSAKELADLFNLVFARHETGTANYSQVVRGGFNGQSLKDAHLLVWAMAKALLAPTSKMAKTILPSEGVEPTRVGAYLSTLVEQMSVRIISIITEDMRREKRGIDSVVYDAKPLSVDAQRTMRTATVEQAAYHRWLDAGGKPEMVLGSALSSRYKSLQEIKEHGEEMMAVWTRYQNSQRQTRSLNELVVIRDVMVNVCMDLIQEMDPDVLTEDMQLYLKRLKDRAETLTVKTMREYIENARDMICYAAFAHTQVKEFLCTMDDFAHDNPGMPPRECARLAAEQVLARWLADQITTSQDRPDIDAARNNECVLTTMAELVVRATDLISGNEVATGLDGTLPILQARADMAMAAVRNELQKAA